jgi:hypothetical protein
MKFDIEEISNFLKEANKSTYANKDASKAASTRLRSDDYHFENGDLIYHDTYFGSRDFIGEEVVYKKEVPIWGANYYGYIFSETTNEKELYGFLRKALMQEYADTIPVRGPEEFVSGEWKYMNKVEGGLERFTGVEEILRSGELLYRCNYHGGLIR